MKEQIEAFIFDFGGVLTLPQDPDCLQTMATLCGVSADEFRAAYRKDRLSLDRGDMEVEEYYKGILRELGSNNESGTNDGLIPRLLELDLFSWARENIGMTAFVQRLKTAGYPLGLLSNMPSYYLPRLKGLLPSFALFDGEVFSCDVGLVKPEPAIYLEALRTLNSAVKCVFKPGQVLFIDDMAVNADAAEALGFNTLVYTDMPRFRKEVTGRYIVSGLCMS